MDPANKPPATNPRVYPTGEAAPVQAKAKFLLELGGNEFVMIPTAVVRQSEMEAPWKPRKMIKDVAVLDSPQPRVKHEKKAHPVKNTFFRPIMSAIEPARRSVQPHVRLVKVRKSACTDYKLVLTRRLTQA